MFWLPAIDPRARILLATIFGIAVVSLQTFSTLMLAFTMAVMLLLVSGQAWCTTLKKMLTMDGFVLAMLLLLPFSVPGDPLFEIAGFSASWQGLWRALEIALKANAVVLALLVLVGSMESVILGQALGLLKVPNTLVHLLLLTVRYIEVLRGEYQRLRQAMKARAFHPRNNWHTYRSIGYLFGMMLVRAVERSERVMEAMKCRGFTGQFPLIVQWQLRLVDWLFSAIMLCLILLLVLMDRFYAVI